MTIIVKSKIMYCDFFFIKTRITSYRFTAVVEEVLQEVCLVEFASSVCTICLLEYYCIVVR